MSKYTPGPWEAIDDGENSPYVIEVNRDSYDSAEVAREIPTMEDARLIAAAPELLDAAQAMFIALDGCDDFRYEDAKRELKAAIAKAIGP